jgi:hypothetical protein
MTGPDKLFHFVSVFEHEGQYQAFETYQEEECGGRREKRCQTDESDSQVRWQ